MLTGIGRRKSVVERPFAQLLASCTKGTLLGIIPPADHHSGDGSMSSQQSTPPESEQSNPLQSRWRRIPGLPKPLQHFIGATLLFMALPLAPLVFELWIMNTISEQSVTLTTAMYAIGIGISSRSTLLFVFTFCVFAFFVFAFGVVMHAEGGKAMARAEVVKRQLAGNVTPVGGLEDKDALPIDRYLAYVAIVLVFGVHFIERYNRHVVDLQPLFEF
jgi:hypothetical protein